MKEDAAAASALEQDEAGGWGAENSDVNHYPKKGSYVARKLARFWTGLRLNPHHPSPQDQVHPKSKHVKNVLSMAKLGATNGTKPFDNVYSIGGKTEESETTTDARNETSAAKKDYDRGGNNRSTRDSSYPWRKPDRICFVFISAIVVIVNVVTVSLLV
jgi:hypothetical protein